MLSVAGLVILGVGLRRLLKPSSKTMNADLGEVSQSWLSEHKAEKRGDGY